MLNKVYECGLIFTSYFSSYTRDGKTEEEELVIPMVQVDRAEIFRKLTEKKLEEDGDNAENKEKGKEEAQAEEKVETKILTLDEQAEAALLEGELVPGHK